VVFEGHGLPSFPEVDGHTVAVSGSWIYTWFVCVFSFASMKRGLEACG
jgi:hypothetical protein